MLEQDFRWREIVATLDRRRRVVIRVFVAAVVLVALGLFLLGPRYPATATLMVTAERARPTVSADPSTGAPVDRVTDEDLNSEVALLQSEPLIREVLADHPSPPRGRSLVGALVQVATFPLEVLRASYRAAHHIPAPTPFDDLVDRTARHLAVRPVKKSSLITVSYAERGVPPAWSADFVNDLVARHMARHSQLSRQPEAQRFFESQRTMLTERSARAEAALLAFHERQGLDSMPEQRQMWRTRLADLKGRLADAEAVRAERTARVAFLTSELERYPVMVRVESRSAQNQAVQYLKPRVMEKEIQRNSLLSTYRPDSLKVRDVERELAAARRILDREKDMVTETRDAANPTHQALEVDLAKARTALAAIQARVEVVQSEIGESAARVERLGAVLAEQDQLEREANAARESLLTYTRKEEARLSSALDQSHIVNLAVARAAEPAPVPASSRALLLFPLGVVASFLFAVLAAFAVDRLDATVKNAREVESLTRLPVLAEVS
jgi:uncharacterized protein involved in exopolysaccharide biosynthesis